MCNFGLLENEINRSLDFDANARIMLIKVLENVRQNYDESTLNEQYENYRLRALYKHCHFIALMMKKIDFQTSMVMMEQNAKHYLLSQYHYAWNLIDTGNQKEGHLELTAVANRGHLFAKKRIFQLRYGKLWYIFYPVFFLYSVVMSMKYIMLDNESMYTEKEF